MANSNYIAKDGYVPEPQTVTNNGNKNSGFFALSGAIAGAAILGAGVLGGSMYFGNQEIEKRNFEQTQSQVSQNTADIGGQSENINNLEGRVSNIGEQTSQNSDSITALEDRINTSQVSGSENLYVAQDCTRAEMRGLRDTIHFYDSRGELLGSVAEVNYENNTPLRFDERVLREFESNIFDPTGIHNSASLTFRVPNGNDLKALYSPNEEGEIRGILEGNIKGDCIPGDYSVTVENRANISPYVEKSVQNENHDVQRDKTQGCNIGSSYTVGGVNVPGTRDRNCN